MTDVDASKSIARSDYRPCRYLVTKVDLTFDLLDDCTRVRSTLRVKLNNDSSDPAGDFELDGLDLKLIELKRDGVLLQSGSDYTPGTDKLIIHGMPEHCEITVETEIYPAQNTVLEGLYQSSGNYCTQCEAEGFRRISYYPDRPDVMACFDVRIIADKKFPVLLSNGNLTGSGDMDDGRHWVQWSDPHPKPSYLFALVAGDLAFIQDEFITAGGRRVDLRIYVENHNIDKCDHAMASLKKAMQWDEQVYGLEYDLDIYMIVAVDDFNMGAMENKGLNIFNSKYVLADQQTATDADFLGVETVIAHEYFHNWTGNRVTCRDWFQLSLKEGLTVFRDQEFSADMNSKAVKRIEDVRLLRARQFPEDAGPMAHPIRPDAYIEINNFYTVTVYEKGAEVIRMMRTLLGQDNFRRGIDLYFERHDGQAVTCEDFIKAMEAASGVDLQQFRHWYSQAGTPVLDATGHYDESLHQFRLKIKQSCPATPGQPQKLPYHLPCTLSLMAPDGAPFPLNTIESSEAGPAELTVDIRETEQEFVFHKITQRPVPSILRGFSAPVKLNYQHSNEDLAFLLANDTDSFNRWEAGQILASRRIEQLAQDAPANDSLDSLIFQGFEAFITDTSVDKALRATALQLPSIEAIAERHRLFEIDKLDSAYKAWRQQMVKALEPALRSCLVDPGLSSEDFLIDAKTMGQRTLHNRCLELLCTGGDSVWSETAFRQFNSATNMTDQLAALASLVNSGSDFGDIALENFYQQWKFEKLVIDKWFSIQAMADTPATVANIQKLLTHKDFDLRNPNRVRSLIGAFAVNNVVRFHSADGGGYQLLTDTIVRLDDINPQVAARLASPLLRWRRFDAARQRQQQQCLERLSVKTGLSKDVYEIVSRALG